MTTVASRRFVSTPQRDAAATWRAIVDILTRGQASQARTELLAVSGVAASVIADKSPESAAIVVTCNGPRTRIYCLYDDNAIDGSDQNEGPLGYDALAGDWHLSIPCSASDLTWVKAALKAHSTRISARDETETLKADEEPVEKSDSSMAVDVEEFLKP